MKVSTKAPATRKGSRPNAGGGKSTDPGERKRNGQGSAVPAGRQWTAQWPNMLPECLMPGRVDFSKLDTPQRRELEALGWTEQTYTNRVDYRRLPVPFETKPLPAAGIDESSLDKAGADEAVPREDVPAGKLSPPASTLDAIFWERFEANPFAHPVTGERVDFAYWREMFAQDTCDQYHELLDLRLRVKYPAIHNRADVRFLRASAIKAEVRRMEPLYVLACHGEGDVLYFDRGNVELYHVPKVTLREAWGAIPSADSLWRAMLERSALRARMWDIWTAGIEANGGKVPREWGGGA